MSKEPLFDWVVVERASPQATISKAGLPPGPGASPMSLGPGGDDFILVAAPAERTEHVVSSGKMSTEEVADLSRSPTFIGAALKMPLSLIRTVGSKDAPGPEPDWGIRATGAHDTAWTGEGVTVAVLDTGIDADHDAFEGVSITSMNFTTDPPGDTDGHGTHCAGTIFGRDVGGTRIGIARGVTNALIGKIIGKNSRADTDVLYRALNWAVMNRADVVSMSVAMDFPGFRERLKTDFLLSDLEATAIALDAYRANMALFDAYSRSALGVPPVTSGSLVVCAAGNESHAPSYSISAAPPGNADGFVSVAALDEPLGGKARLASFSNVGAKFAAPGVGILSAAAGGGLVRMDGTSMATPIVSGVACLWFEKLRKQGYPADARAVLMAMSQAAIPLDPAISRRDVLIGGVRVP